MSSNNVTINNLTVLSDLKVGEKLIVEGEILKKEERAFMLELRRGIYHAFNVETLKKTFKEAITMFKNGGKSYLYADAIKIKTLGKQVQSLLPTALKGLKNLSETYENENKIEVSQKIKKLYLKYLPEINSRNIEETKKEKPIDFEINSNEEETQVNTKKGIRNRVHNALDRMNQETIKRIQNKCQHSKLKSFLSSPYKHATITDEIASIFKKEMPDLTETYENLEQNRIIKLEKNKNEELRSLIKQRFNSNMLKKYKRQFQKIETVNEIDLKIPEEAWKDEEIFYERRTAHEEAQHTLKKSISVFEFKPKTNPVITNVTGLDDNSLKELKMAIKHLRRQHEN